MDWQAFVRDRVPSLADASTPGILDELAQHLGDLYDEAVREGRSHDEAVAMAREAIDEDRERLTRALVELHGRTKEAKQQRGAPAGAPLPESKGWTTMLDDLRRDVLYAFRMLLRTPGLTFIAVMTLALGIGATTAVFSLINATLLARLPVADVDRLVYVGNGASFSYPSYVDLRDRNDALDGLIAWGGITASLNAENEADTVSGAIVTGNYFEVLGVTAALGRVLSVDDDVTPGGHPVAVISHGLWQRRFGARLDIIGRPIVLNGQTFTIVGVTKPDFNGAQLGVRYDLYVPMMMQAVMRPPRAGYSGEMDADLLRRRTNSWLFALGKLRASVTLPQAQASLSALQTSLDAPGEPRAGGTQPRITLAPVSAGPPRQRDQLLSVAALLVSVVGAVLLIACANVANLQLSRAVTRRREVAVRLAVGAGRWRLVRQLLTESVLLAFIGGLAGVLLAYGIVQAFRAWPPPAGALPLVLEFSLDGRVLLFTLALSIITGIVFGLAPALATARPALVAALKDESFIPDERSRRLNLKNGLVVWQVALSLALLIGSGLLLRSLQQAQRIDPGYAVDRIMTLELPVNLLRYTSEQGREFYRRVIERAEAVPGVESAAVVRVAVLTGSARVSNLHIEGREGPDNQRRTDGGGLPGSPRDLTHANVISPKYLATMGLRLVEGRDFGVEDVETSTPSVIVNETFVKRHFPDGRAIGKRLSLNGPEGPWRVVVGVVTDGKYESLNEAPVTIAYVPLSQNHETGMTLCVRTAMEPAAIAGWIRREVQALEPNLPLGEPRLMTETLGTSLYAARVGTLLISVLGGLALLLAAIGLYGVLAFNVSRRSREIGIRSALGARSSSLFRMVVFEGLTLVGVGVALGVFVARSTSNVINAFLVGVSPTDVATYVGTVCVLALVALAACAAPAWRATKLDPLIALRQQ